jgi:hypothetical protein
VSQPGIFPIKENDATQIAMLELFVIIAPRGR